MRVLGVDLAWASGNSHAGANDTGVVALEESGVVVDAGWTVGLDDTVAWIEDNAAVDCMVFVDASLVVTNPRGQRLAETQVGQRYGRWKVSANSTNTASPHTAGVRLLERLVRLGWVYADGRTGPPTGGRTVSECYPYTTIVGCRELGYDDERPPYKRKPRSMPAAVFRPRRAQACDELIRRIAGLRDADPPIDLLSHPVTSALVETPSPLENRPYKRREDLLDAAICAWTAALWHRHGTQRCQVLGGPERDGADDGPIGTIIAPARPAQRRDDAGG